VTQKGVAPDGSPVALYLALPAGEAPQIIHDAVPDGGTILELGCGAGRLTRVLVAYGHPVWAVDNSPEMLEHVTGAVRLCADILQLSLGSRRFDAVVAASHFVDAPDPADRAALLAMCRGHVEPDGVVILQRHDPEWASDPADSSGWHGPVEIAFRVVEHRGTTYDAEVTYRLGARSWTQPFTAAVIDDDLLAAEADAAGLRVDRFLDDARRWALLRPVG
jgi:SAM-dependent methyltransferase